MIRLAGMVAFLVLLAGGAEAADYIPLPETRTLTPGDAPYCDEPWVLDRVVDRAEHNERHVWHSLVEVAIAGDIREYDERWPYGSQIARRYCRAEAQLSDGRTPYVFYLIETRQGFAGQGADVTACIADRDRWHIHDAACRTVRP